ncbi:MAG TPA: hypothetical protein VJU13_13035 [Candidatus Nitrosocosmicus sp.]|jgi:hypothetical protein|nr:hypothetical protein [Candidatus Nitrosocosmicus sp.]
MITKLIIGKWINSFCNKLRKNTKDNNSASSSRAGDPNQPING